MRRYSASLHEPLSAFTAWSEPGVGRFRDALYIRFLRLMGLNSLAEPLISRRTLLLGTLGLWVGAFVAACTGRSPSALSSPSASASASSSSVATPACVVAPAETEGPYFVDERLNRSDITTDPSTGSARSGVPLALTFNVARVGTGGGAGFWGVPGGG